MEYNISHSEVDLYTRCQQAHLYNYSYGLVATKAVSHVQKGTVLHKLLEVYYEQIRLGNGFEDGYDAGLSWYAKAVAEKLYPIDILNHAKRIFDKYVDHYDPREWEVLDAEGYYEYRATLEITFNFSPDLIVRQKRRSNKYYGQIGVIDHKSSMNFLTYWETIQHTQLPKYIYALNMLDMYNGEQITHGVLNQLRTREMVEYDPEKWFNRFERDWPVKHQEGIFAEYLKVAKKIAARRAIPVAELKGDWTTKTLQKDVCKFCDYVQPCNEELRGSSTVATTLRVYFKEKDLSYRTERKLKNGPSQTFGT
jgi:hypothetical protein